jgi:hypothetical protein
MRALVSNKKMYDMIKRGKKINITGDLRGDKFQYGGALVVDKGGKSLVEFVQTGPTDNISFKDIMTAFGLDNK